MSPSLRSLLPVTPDPLIRTCYLKQIEGQCKLEDSQEGTALAQQHKFWDRSLYSRHRDSDHCVSCHSITEDLKGIGAKYEPVTLPGKFLQPDSTWTEGTPPHPVNAISVTVALPTGDSFTGVPFNYDDFNVSLREPSGAYRSFERGKDGPRVEIHNRLQVHFDLLMHVRHLTLARIFRIKLGITPNAIVGGEGPVPEGRPSDPGVSTIKSTPLMVNGIFYFSTPDNAWAVDARSGREIWHYT